LWTAETVAIGPLARVMTVHNSKNQCVRIGTEPWYMRRLKITGKICRVTIGYSSRYRRR